MNHNFARNIAMVELALLAACGQPEPPAPKPQAPDTSTPVILPTSRPTEAPRPVPTLGPTATAIPTSEKQQVQDFLDHATFQNIRDGKAYPISYKEFMADQGLNYQVNGLPNSRSGIITKSL